MHLTINYCPYPYQEDMHLSPHRFRLIVGGRRVGKSQCAMMEVLRHCLSTPRALAWWVAPTYKDAKEIGWEEFLNHFEIIAPAVTSMHSTNLNISFVNGSKLYFKGSDNYDSLRGRGLTFVVLDEAAFCHEDTWKKALRPALSDRQGRAIFTSTPNGRNWFYDQYKYAGYKHNVSWHAWKWPTELNPLITPEDLEDAKAELSPNDFRQEYLADFVTKAGMVYDDFTDDNVISSFTYNPRIHDIYLGIDFGYASYTAVCFFAVDRLTEQVVQFDELYLTRVDIQGVSRQIKAKIDEHKLPQPKALYTDPAGNAEELSSGISPVDYLRSDGFTVINKGTNIAPGLTLVRSFILNAAGKRRFFIHERCRETIRSFYGYSYRYHINQIVEEPDKDGVHDHCCDAVRYFFVNRFDHAKYVCSSIDSNSYLVGKKKKPFIMKRCGNCKNQFLSRTRKTEPPHLCNDCREKINAT